MVLANLAHDNSAMTALNKSAVGVDTRTFFPLTKTQYAYMHTISRRMIRLLP